MDRGFLSLPTHSLTTKMLMAFPPLVGVSMLVIFVVPEYSRALEALETQNMAQAKIREYQRGLKGLAEGRTRELKDSEARIKSILNAAPAATVRRMHSIVQASLSQDGGEGESDDGLELGGCLVSGASPTTTSRSASVGCRPCSRIATA